MAHHLKILRIAQELDEQLADQPELRAELMMLAENAPHELLPWLNVVEHAESVLGDLHSAVAWFRNPESTLNGATPASLLYQPDGVELAQTILTKMQQKKRF
ncbi:Protein of unknown function [Andreprevotia lacus DSM 23236]|jgi:uncharacterized protein (DUF2384 family)|uniref:Antitoxin Xre/MbcA/ParS-like toxin-binding domain-containing protein n=1 Tax=Andreprevotia lacus DSM 23236 TaxID=1121001 RepID=A0A1W1XRF7_9NEIS|nr:antitoxin Xre/MbcA/ParS toxin-binding domain-containing protein [Andreprevotia lacus]SMC26486.1 Protein of unknown function [Andreprevotia lacus DSM 23236]